MRKNRTSHKKINRSLLWMGDARRYKKAVSKWGIYVEAEGYQGEK